MPGLRAYKSSLVSFLVGFCMLAAAVTSAAGLSLAFASFGLMQPSAYCQNKGSGRPAPFGQ